MADMSYLVENYLKVSDADAVSKVGDEALAELLDTGEGKFYGYFDNYYLSLQDTHGQEGRVKGEIFIYAEISGRIVKCRWDEEGFSYDECEPVPESDFVKIKEILGYVSELKESKYKEEAENILGRI